jgi:hypothetical protein
VTCGQVDALAAVPAAEAQVGGRSPDAPAGSRR